MCHKEITLVYFHPLFASHPFTLLPSLHGSIQGRIQDFNKGGGGAQNTVCFFDRRQPWKSRKSQKSWGGGGGGATTLFFGAPPASRVAQVPNGGGGGGEIRHISVFWNIYFTFKIFLKGGGARVGCPPLNPPLAPSIHVPIIMMITVLKI